MVIHKKFKLPLDKIESMLEFQSVTQGRERESKHNALHFWGGHAKTSPEIQKLFLWSEICGCNEPSKLEKI